MYVSKYRMEVFLENISVKDSYRNKSRIKWARIANKTDGQGI